MITKAEAYTALAHVCCCSASPAIRGRWARAHSAGKHRDTVALTDGRRMVTVTADETARLWFAAIEDWLAEAARLIQRDPPIFTDEERRRLLHE